MLNALLDRGKKGQEGGLVPIDSADPAEIARVFAEKAGWSLEDASANLRFSQEDVARARRSIAELQAMARRGTLNAIPAESARQDDFTDTFKAIRKGTTRLERLFHYTSIQPTPGTDKEKA